MNCNVSTKWVSILLAIIAIAGYFMVHTMTFEDELREQAHHCEMVADGHWPADPVRCPPAARK